MTSERMQTSSKQAESATETWGASGTTVNFNTTQEAATARSYETLSDPELIERIKADDEDAWDVLMQRHASKSFQVAYGVLGHWNDAEEVVQDAFVRVYRALPGFRGDSEFSTWLYRIVVNQARNKYRWNRRRNVSQHFSIDEEIDPYGTGGFSRELRDDSKGPVDELMFREWESEVSREMAALPSINREALLLRNVHNLSYEQIAEILDCKLGTVKSRIARARDELRKRVGM